MYHDAVQDQSAAGPNFDNVVQSTDSSLALIKRERDSRSAGILPAVREYPARSFVKNPTEVGTLDAP